MISSVSPGQLVDLARDRDRECGLPVRPAFGEQAHEQEQRLVDGNLVALLVHEVEPLAGLVEDGAEIGTDRRHEALRVPDRLRQALANGRLLREEAMGRDRLDAERADDERQHERRRGVAVVDDDPEPPLAHRGAVDRGDEVLGVALTDARRIGHGADGPGSHAPELLPHVVPLDLLLETRRQQDPRRLVDPDEDRLGIEVAEPDVHRRRVALGLQHVSADGGRRDAQVGDVEAGRVQARDHGALDHAAARRRVAARDDAIAALQSRSQGGREPGGGLGRQVDVDEPGDAVLAEEPRRRPRLPDQVLEELGAGLDLLVGVDPDVRHDARLGADRHLVADRRTLLDPHVVADVARAADDRALDQRAATDVGRRVDHRAHGAGALAQRDAVREDGVRADGCVAGDPAVVADEGGPFDLLGVVDVGALADPDVAAQADAADVQLHLLVERVEICLPVLVEVADVLPVPLHHVPVDRTAHLEQEREELLREVVRPVGRNVPEHLGLEHVDARVDRVREDLAPGRLLEEALDLAVVVGDDDPELERVVDRLQPDRDVGAAPPCASRRARRGRRRRARRPR